MATDTWTASSGNWTTAADWNGGEPTSSSDVVVASTSNVTVTSPTSSVVVNTIDVNATDTLFIQNGGNTFTATDGALEPVFGVVDVGNGTFAIGSDGTSIDYSNAGILLLDSTTNPPNPSVLFVEGNARFIGGGTIQLSLDGLITGDFNNATLTNVDNTVVSDSGDIRALNFINQSSVEAATDGVLTVEGSAEGGSFDNQNLLQANEGGTLVLGEIGHNATIINTGTIELQNNDFGFTTKIEIAGNVTIDCTGGGQIVFSGENSVSSSIVSTGGTASLTLVGGIIGGVGGSHVIPGGSIGDANLTLNLQDFDIDIESGETLGLLVLAAANTTVDSNSQIVAARGGEIFLEGPVSDSGVILASSGGEIFVSSTITEQGQVAIEIAQGGTLSLTSAGRIFGLVAFVGSDATLKLSSASEISESLVDAAAGDNIDLTYQAFDPTLVAVWDQGQGSGTLFIEKNGAIQTVVSLSGQYTSGDFALSNDGNGDTLVQLVNSGPNTPPPSATTADLILRDGSNGDYEIFDLGSNAIQAAYTLGQTGTEWQVAGLGGFDGADTSDMMLRDSTTGAFEVFDVSANNITNEVNLGQVGLEWQVAGFGDFSSRNESDMLMRDSVTGQFEIFDIANNAITSAAPMGQVGTEWQVAGFGDFSTRAGETDMLMRDARTGQFEVFDISNNQLTSATSMGQVGSEWQVLGFGDFSGNANETDMLTRDVNNGDLEIYDIRNNAITSAASMGQVGIEWQVLGFGPINGAGASDMLMRDTNNGTLEVFDIANNRLTAAAAMGQIGSEWTAAGIAADPPGSANAQFAQAMAGYASGGGALAASPTLDQATLQPAAAAVLAPANSVNLLSGYN